MLVRNLIVSILILLTTGCSRTEFAYRNADWFLEIYAKQTVDANFDQIEQWRPILQSELEYHRVELLPLLIAYLDLMERASRYPDEEKLAGCLVDAGLYLYQRHAQLAVDLAVPLLMTLDYSQLRHLTEYMARQQQKARNRYLKTKSQSQHEVRMARFIERTERWTGELNDAQLQDMEQAIRRIPDLSENWLSFREQQTAGLLQLLEINPDERLVRKYLSDWWISFEQRSFDYDQDWNIAKHEFVDLLQKLGASLTERQRKTLAQRIASFRKDLKLFQEPLPQPGKTPEILLCSSPV